MAMGQFGKGQDIFNHEPFGGKPGMLRITAMILFRNEQDMLSFAGTIQVGDEGALQAAYHYDPQHAIVLRGAAFPHDISRLFLNATEFPGITHFESEVESVEKQEVTA